MSRHVEGVRLHVEVSTLVLSVRLALCCSGVGSCWVPRRWEIVASWFSSIVVVGELALVLVGILVLDVGVVHGLRSISGSWRWVLGR